MTPEQAIAFIRHHGMVLESARGPVPSLAEEIVGERIKGSWWGHPRSHAIHAVTQAVRGAEEILVCRLVEGKVTFVHRDMWSALVRLETVLDHSRLASVQEVHTKSGRHAVSETPFPEWVPADILEKGQTLDIEEARRLLAPILDR